MTARQLIESGSNIKTVCAWCGAHMHGDPSAPDISHGQCEPCHDKTMNEIDTLFPDRTAKDKKLGESAPKARPLIEAEEYATNAPSDFTRLFKVDLTSVKEMWGSNTTYWEGPVGVDDKSWEIDCSDRSCGGLFNLIPDDDAIEYAMSKLRDAGFDTNSDEFQQDFDDGLLDITACIGTVAWVTYNPDEKRYSPFGVTQTPAKDHEIDYGPGSSAEKPPTERLEVNPASTRAVSWDGQGRLPDEYRGGGNGPEYEDA